MAVAEVEPDTVRHNNHMWLKNQELLRATRPSHAELPGAHPPQPRLPGPGVAPPHAAPRERGHALAGAARRPRAVPGVRPAVRRDLARHAACPLRHQRVLPRVWGGLQCAVPLLRRDQPQPRCAARVASP